MDLINHYYLLLEKKALGPTHHCLQVDYELVIQKQKDEVIKSAHDSEKEVYVVKHEVKET